MATQTPAQATTITTTTTDQTNPPSPSHSESHFTFTTIPNIFTQSLPETDPTKFNYATSNFGLISRSYPSDPPSSLSPDPNTQWHRLSSYISHLNTSSPETTKYKLLILGRHGQGLHNVAETRYGTEMWDCKYSLLEGDETGNWFDAKLTEVGRGQAREAHKAWRVQIKGGIPRPGSYYVSPLLRCCETAWITFDGLGGEGELGFGGVFRPLVKEVSRYTI